MLTATMLDTPASRYFHPRETSQLPVRRGALVLSMLSDTAGVGHVEGLSFLGGESAHVVRWSNGVVDTWEHLGTLVAVDAGTTLVADTHNNVGRLCNVRGDGVAGEPVRCWRVVSTVSGGRYLVAHTSTAEVRVVSHRYDMTNLY